MGITDGGGVWFKPGAVIPYNVTTSSNPVFDIPRPTLSVVRLVCWKCTKDEGKFLLESGGPFTPAANVWCEECYMVKQLAGPPEAPK